MATGKVRGFRHGPCVVMQHRWADRPIRPVEDDGAVHLAGKANRLQPAKRPAG